MESPRDNLKSYVDEATTLVETLAQRELKRFADRATRSFYFHRSTGIALILFSSSLPFVATIETELVRKFVMPILAVGIAFLTGLTAFMAYGESWKNYRKSEIRTRYALETWKARILSAQFIEDRNEAMARAKEASYGFFLAMEEIANIETESFFKRLEESQKALAKNDR